VVRFVDKKISYARENKTGEKLLKEIRGYYIDIFHTGDSKTQASEILREELLTQLNNLIDNRGDRISLSTQRLFESLNLIAVVTSILWLVPFYFLHFQGPQGQDLQLGIFGWLLVIFVTFLIIMILSIIDDLDKPFDGYWMVNIKSWEDLVGDIKAEYKSRKLQGTKNIPQTTPAKQDEGAPSPGETKSSSALPQVATPQPLKSEAQPGGPSKVAEHSPAPDSNTNHAHRESDPLIRLLALKYLLFGFPNDNQGK
jgi:hypothetical protein